MRPTARLGPLGPPIARYNGPTTCEATGCRATTREGKPYCPEHVDHHPYVQEILAQLAAIDEELKAVGARGWRAVDLNGVTADDITRFLHDHGVHTVERVRRDYLWDYPENVARAYATALAKAKRVALGRTPRGKLCLRAM